MNDEKYIITKEDINIIEQFVHDCINKNSRFIHPKYLYIIKRMYDTFSTVSNNTIYGLLNDLIGHDTRK